MNIKELKKVLKKELLLSSKVFIAGHNDLDLDAIAAAIGISLIAKKYHKDSYIVTDDLDLEPGVEKVINEVKKDFTIINTKKLKTLLDDNSILIIVDTNVGKLVCCNDFIEKFSKVIVIDHHKINKGTLNVENLFIFDDVSSTCEIMTALIKEIGITLTDKLATIILSGIVLDTNNFTTRCDRTTFYYAYHLLSKGASLKDVQTLLKQDMAVFIKNQKILTNTKILPNGIALANGEENEIYHKPDLAKMAELLLEFNGIETTFVYGYIANNVIGVSARSRGDINVGLLMEKLMGGGSEGEAATRIENKTLKETEKVILKILKNRGNL